MLSVALGETIAHPVSLVLGGFDGLHVGHRQLIHAAKETGLPVAITTIYGGKGKAMFTERERVFLFAAAHVAFVIGIEFTEQVRALCAEEFLRLLFSTVNCGLIVCGRDFRFGKDASGTPELIEKIAPCPLKIVETVNEDELSAPRASGGKVSTTACKEYLERGELARLNACLADGRSEYGYFLSGEVLHGREVGRSYGFPTLNLAIPPQKLLPPDGVYGGLCATPKGDFPCIMNLGARPTFGIDARLAEIHLDGFAGDLYGAYVRAYPTEKFRDIRKFASAEELKAQLLEDIRRLRS